MKKSVPYILFFVFLALVGGQDAYVRYLRNREVKPRNYTVVLSVDAFRSDYQSLANTPTLDSISKMGVKAKGFQPVFPSLTFVNHYTMATGLYPQNHGIVANNFWERGTKRTFSMGDKKTTTQDCFYGGEPIWVTAESQKVKSATISWVGSDTRQKGYRPSRWSSYNADVPFKSRIDSVIEWLNVPYSERPHLAMCYIEETDNAGHNFGPDSDEIKLSIQKVDSLIAYFMSRLDELSFRDSINFIVVSDHGMAPISAEKVIDLATIAKSSWIDTLISSPAISFAYCKKDCEDSLMSVLGNVEGLTSWKRADSPERFHYADNKRIGDVVMLSDSGWSQIYNDRRTLPKGMHGFDNANPLMNGVFYAVGPDFKVGYEAPQLQNIDLYELLCRLLEINPAQNDGQIERIECVLK